MVSIDPYPPFRRPLSRDCCPTPPGRVNLSCLIWRREDEIYDVLADLGLPFECRKVGIPPRLDLLRQRLESERRGGPFVPSTGVELVLHVIQPDEQAVPGETTGLEPGRRLISFHYRPLPPAARARSGGARPEETEAAAESREDDLTRIRGIAAGRQKALRDAGISSYGSLAAAPASRLRELFPAVAETALEAWREAARELAAESKDE